MRGLTPLEARMLEEMPADLFATDQEIPVLERMERQGRVFWLPDKDCTCEVSVCGAWAETTMGAKALRIHRELLARGIVLHAAEQAP